MFSITVSPIIVLAYVLLARREERKVIEEFRDAYRAYQRQVPMFIPRLGHWKLLIERSNMANEKPEDPPG